MGAHAAPKETPNNNEIKETRMESLYNATTISLVLLAIYLATIVHIIASKRITESSKIYWVIASIIIPVIPYLLWRMVSKASPTDSLDVKNNP